MSDKTASEPTGKKLSAAGSGTLKIGDDLAVTRLGFGAMRITGKGVWGPPQDHDESIRVLRRAVELGIDFIDTDRGSFAPLSGRIGYCHEGRV